MIRNALTEKAHKALSDVDLIKVQLLISSVNLSLIEKKVITASELDRIRIAEIAEQINLSIDSVMRIKTAAMKKIALYLQKNDR